jgi:hypothetical protein
MGGDGGAGKVAERRLELWLGALVVASNFRASAKSGSIVSVEFNNSRQWQLALEVDGVLFLTRSSGAVASRWRSSRCELPCGAKNRSEATLFCRFVRPSARCSLRNPVSLNVVRDKMGLRTVE